MDGNGDAIWGSDMGAYEAEGPTLVELDQFTAVSKGNQITITWTTASEIDNAGFNIWRSTTKNVKHDDNKINSTIIPAVAGATDGATYSYIDDKVVPGVTYYYQLEDINARGLSTFHGPVSAAIPAQKKYMPLPWYRFGGSVSYPSFWCK